MKKLGFLVFALAFLASAAYADEAATLSGVTLKQGMVYDWSTGHSKNLTTFEIARTRPAEAWGKWNMLWDGWTLDAGLAYDGAGLNTVAVFLGRDFGKLGNYLPIDFPLKNVVSISIYPIGVYVDDIDGDPTISACTGGSFVKLSVNF